MAIPGVVFVGHPDDYIPPSPDAGRINYLLWIEGWDGSNWALHDDSNGLVVKRGIRGLGGITVENHRDQHASLAGSRFRDFRALDREIFLPLHLFSDGTSRDWVAHNRAFSRIFRAGKTVWLHIVIPGGEHRKIEARYEKGFDGDFEMDPAFYGWASYGLYLNAEKPYWRLADPIREVFQSVTQRYFFGGQEVGVGVETAGPPFHIIDDRSLATSSISNPGDIKTRPIIRIYGPSDTATVGVAGQVIEVPFEVPADEVLTIDCNPSEQTAIMSTGVDMTPELGTFNFPSIEPGEEVPLVTDMDGAGRIEVELYPEFEWGLS